MAVVDEKKEGHPTMAPAVEHFTAEERAARGRAARAECPRSSHAGFELAPDRDPVAILEAQATSRVPELVPVRYGRMLVSPFTFYRGAAAVMAHDLAPTPRAGLQAQLCGDAHLSNFGGYASPERSLVFDLNDFDETLPGPFEWDVKRLAASFEIAGRDRDFTDTQRTKAVLSAVRAYREWMRRLAEARNLDVWYAQPRRRDDRAAARTSSRRSTRRTTVAKAAAKARTKDSLKAFAKLTQDGRRRAAHRLGSTVDRRGSRPRPGGGDPVRAARERDPRAVPRVPPDAAGRPSPPGRGVPHGRHRPQGRRRRQRRHAVLDPPAARPRRRRPALPADQGGAGIGARAVPRQERVREPRPAGRRRPAADAVDERHLPRLAARRR